MMIKYIAVPLFTLIFGFISGVVYGTYHMIEVDESTLVEAMKALKTLIGAIIK